MGFINHGQTINIPGDMIIKDVRKENTHSLIKNNIKKSQSNLGIRELCRGLTLSMVFDLVLVILMKSEFTNAYWTRPFGVEKLSIRLEFIVSTLAPSV